MSAETSLQEKIANLELILNESKNLRNEVYENIDKNMDLTWKQISLLTFLAGTFFALTQYIYKITWKTETVFLIFAAAYVFFAFLFSIYEIYPRERLRDIDPEAIYKERLNSREEILLNFIKTYLVNINKVKRLSKTTLFIRKGITALTFGFVMQVSIIMEYYNSKNFDLSLLLSFIIASFIITFILACWANME